MTYDKETRAEEMETELREDNIREKAQEFDDGVFDTWIGDNKNELLAEFINVYNNEWKDFCKENWNEANKE